MAKKPVNQYPRTLEVTHRFDEPCTCESETPMRVTKLTADIVEVTDKEGTRLEVQQMVTLVCDTCGEEHHTCLEWFSSI